MRSVSKNAIVIAASLVLAAAGSAQAANVSMQDLPTNKGFMNVSELPSNGGAFVFPSSWGPADLRANWTGSVLKLEAAPIGDPNQFWYQGAGTSPGAPGAPGNKQMEANYYVEDDSLNGQTVTFSMNVLENTLVSGYTAIAFIKDFAPDYSSNVTVTAPLTPGAFSISHVTSGAAGRHIQYGFQVVGPNVWPTDVASKGYVTITAVPEPASLTALAGLAAMAVRRRRGA